MKYQLIIRSQPNPSITIQEKHERFLSSLNKIESFWTSGLKIPEQVPNPGIDLSTAVKISSSPKGLVSGEILYKLRGEYLSKKENDTGFYDDYLLLEFNPSRVPYQLLVEKAFSTYVLAFQAYRGQVADAEFVQIDFQQLRNTNFRQSIYRIHAVSFFSRELCQRAFHLTPENIAERLSNEVDRINLEAGGVMILASSDLLSLQRAQELSNKLKSFLSC